MGEDVTDARRVPERTCVGCRDRDMCNRLVRLVWSDDRVMVDWRRCLPGRGAWIHPVPACVIEAKKHRAFLRAFRIGPEQVHAGVFDEILETPSGSYGADRCVADESGLEADGHPMSTQR